MNYHQKKTFMYLWAFETAVGLIWWEFEYLTGGSQFWIAFFFTQAVLSLIAFTVVWQRRRNERKQHLVLRYGRLGYLSE